VTGILKERYFQEGRDVSKGEKLYKIDPVPFQAAVDSAKARIASAEARLVQARQNLARVKPLLAEQAVSQKDVDDAIAEELAAKAQLEGAKGDLVRANWELENTLIVAPITGMIERTRFYEGRLISAQTDLLTIIHKIDPMYVIVSAPESFLLKHRQGAVAMGLQRPWQDKLKGVIKFADGSTYNHDGVLDFADVGLKMETGSRQVRFVFPNPKRVLLPGQFVTVRIKGAIRSHVILVPQRAVQQGPKGSIVFVVGEGDKTEIRPVKASSWQGDQWIIEEGLRLGERVVVDGFHRITPGQPVKAVDASPQPSADGAGTGSAEKTGNQEAAPVGPKPSPAPAPAHESTPKSGTKT
jgi:membrane fusion protein (multidrug efflux system)